MVFQHQLANVLFISCFSLMFGQMCSDLNNFSQLKQGIGNNGETFLTLATPGLLYCVRECLVRRICLSFNFNLTASTCDLKELNISTFTQVPGQEIVSSNIDTWSASIAGGCSDHSCGHNQVCVIQPTTSTPYECATQCLQLPEIEHGKIVLPPTNRDVGTTLKLECDLGYIATDDVVCKDDGTWGSVKCEMGCFLPPVVPNAIMTSPSQHIWKQGSLLKYECSSGYLVVGTRTCLDNGNWSVVYCGQRLQSCLDVKNCDSAYGDGEYCLSSSAVNNSLLKIYCHDMMSSTPKEYITLNPDTNILDFRYTSCTANNIANCDDIQQFAKVRISNLKEMVVGYSDIRDTYFALPPGVNCWRQYGGSLDCSQQCLNPHEHARKIGIDTSGTGVIVSSKTVWVHDSGQDNTAIVTETRTNNGRSISIVCSLSCYWCFPIHDTIFLDLDPFFQPPFVSATLPGCAMVQATP